jgi:tetratricopeptide (TPR) repeat protein
MTRAEEIARAVKSAALYHKKDIDRADELLRHADENNPDTWIYRGNLRFEKGEFEDAIRCYDEALRRSNENVPAMYNKVSALLQIGRYDEAFQILKYLAEKNPDVEEIWNNLGNIYVRKGMREEAIKAYTRALELNPEYALCRYNFGMLLAHIGDYEKAIEQFSLAIKTEKDMDVAYSAKASCEYALRRFEDALESLNHAIALSPKNVDAWLLRGAVLAEMEKIEDAFNTFKEAIKIAPENAEPYFTAGKLAFRANRLKESESFLKDGIEKAPESAEAWDLLAEVEYNLGRYDEAIYAGERAIALLENYEHKWYTEYIIGSACAEKGEYLDAQRYFERCITANPGFGEAYVKMGFALLETGQREKGLAFLEEAVQISPDNWHVHYLIAKGKFELGEIEDAFEHLSRALNLNERSSEAYVLMGRIHMLKGAVENATECFQKAIDLNPLSVEGWYYKGRVLFDKKEYENAIAAFNIALEINPWHYNAQYYRALGYEELNELEKAIQCYEAILKISPSDYQALFNSGKLYMKMENWSTAAGTLKKAYEKKQTYECALLLGKSLVKSGDTERAMEYFSKAIEINPLGHEAYFESGKIQLELGELESARTSFELALKIEQNTEYSKHLGIVYYRQENYASAIEIFDKISDDESLFYAADCAAKLGMDDKALAYLNRITLTGAHAWLLKGGCEEKLGKFEDALFSYAKGIEVAPDALELWLAKGNLLFKLERYSAAKACFEHILSSGKEDADTLKKIAEVYLKLGENEKCIATIEKLEALGERADRHMLSLLGEAYFNLKDYEKALEALNRALEIASDSDLLLRVAKIYVLMEKYGDAIPIFEKYIEMVPDNIEAYRMLSECYYIEGQTEKCLHALDNCIALNKNAYEAWYNKGTILIKLKRYPEAEEVLLKASELAPQNPNVWNNLGIAYMMQNKFEEALNAFDAAISAELNNSEAWYNKGCALLKLGRNKESIECFDRAISINPEYVDALFVKGSAYYTMGAFEEACKVLDAFIEKRREHLEARVLRGRALMALQQYARAKEDFLYAISLAPGNPENYKLCAEACASLLDWENVYYFASEALSRNSHDADAWFLKGLAELHNGHYIDAVKFFEYAIELKPDMISAYFMTAVCHALQEENENTLDVLERCVNANPNNATCVYYYASALARAGKKDAEKWFDIALNIKREDRTRYAKARLLFNEEKYIDCIDTLREIKTMDFPVHYLLGLCHLRLGDFSNAVQEFTRCLELKPDFQLAQLEHASALYAMQKYSEALHVLENTHVPEARKLRGFVYAKLEMWEKAIAELSAIEQKESDPEIAITMAHALFALQRYREAQEYIKIVKELKPASGESLLLVARATALEYAMNKSQETLENAISSYLNVIKIIECYEAYYELADLLVKGERYADAETYAHILAERFAQFEGLVLAGKIFEHNGKLDMAVQCYKQALERMETIEVLERLSRCYLVLGKYQEAIEIAEKAVHAKKDSGALHTLAIAYAHTKNPDALSYLEEALRSGFVDEELLVAYSTLLLENKAYEKVVALFENYMEKHGRTGRDASLALVRALSMLGRNKEALDILDNALIDGENWELLKMRGDLLANLGELDETIAHYEKALAMNPDNPELNVILAEHYLSKGNGTKAKELAERALLHDKKNGRAWYVLARCTDTDARYEHIEKALQYEPDNASAWIFYGKLLLKKGEVEKANNCFENALKHSQAEEVLLFGARAKLQAGMLEAAASLLSKIGAESNEKLEIEAMLEFQRKDYRRAVECYNKLISNTSNSEYFVWLARAYSALGDLEHALEAYARAIENQPANEDIWEEMLEIQMSAKMFERLRATLENYLRLNPDNALAYYNLGILLLREGNTARAEEMFKKSIALNERYEKAWNGLGDVYFKKNAFDKAVECFSRACELNPGYWRAFYNLALVYARKKEFARAYEMCTHAWELVPDNVEVGLLAGTLLMNMKRIKEAEAVFTRLMKRYGDNERVQFNLGLVHMMAGNLDTALDFFTRAIEKKREYVEAWINKGIIHYQKKDYTNAGIAFETVLELDRNNKIAKKYLDEIEREK